jgi:hypothetical protein
MQNKEIKKKIKERFNATSSETIDRFIYFAELFPKNTLGGYMWNMYKRKIYLDDINNELAKLQS